MRERTSSYGLGGGKNCVPARKAHSGVEYKEGSTMVTAIFPVVAALGMVAVVVVVAPAMRLSGSWLLPLAPPEELSPPPG